jgi:hypothetical protein
MSPGDASLTADQHPGTRTYALLCMAALTGLLAALVLRRAEPWALFPVLLGGVAMVFRWRAGPVLVLLAVALLLWTWWIGISPGWLFSTAAAWVRRWLLGYPVGALRLPVMGRTPSRGVLPLSDLLLAVSLLGYAAAHYRLQGLVTRLLPAEPRRHREPARRAPELVTAGEVLLLLLALPVCGGLAYLFAGWLRGRETELEIADSAWQGILVLWLGGGGVLGVAALLRYLALRRMTPAEAAMYLQDVLWRETRAEQRRLNRWLVWAWLRRRRREEEESS